MYLEKIIAYKKKEVVERKALYSSKLLEKSIYFDGPVVSLKEFLKREDKQGVIAEFKRKSPSKGAINLYASVEEVSLGYMQAGSAALSVLTDQEFFGGSYADLTEVRKFNYAPILNKNFIVDEYQILEAKSIGADAILLIAECLEKEKLQAFAKTAKSVGLEVLMELHSVNQLDKLSDDIDLVGVNNRNLKTFEVDVVNSFRIGSQIPRGFVKIAESGINDPQTVVDFKKEGFDGFLIGECFMREADPGLACREFHQTLDALVKLQLEKEVI